MLPQDSAVELTLLNKSNQEEKQENYCLDDIREHNEEEGTRMMFSQTEAALAQRALTVALDEGHMLFGRMSSQVQLYRKNVSISNAEGAYILQVLEKFLE